MIINFENMQELFTALSAALASRMAAAPPKADRYSTTIPVSTDNWVAPWMDEFPDLKQWKGSKQYKSLATYVYRLTTEPFESTVKLDTRKLKKLFGTVAEAVAGLGPITDRQTAAANRHKERRCATQLLAGESVVGPDGTAFFGNGHENGQDNRVGSGAKKSFLIDTTKGLLPVLFLQHEAPHLVNFNGPPEQNLLMFLERAILHSIEADDGVGFGLWQTCVQMKEAADATAADMSALFTEGRLAMEMFHSLDADSGNENTLDCSPTLWAVGPSQRSAAEQVIKAQFLEGGGSNTLFNAVELLVLPQLG